MLGVDIGGVIVDRVAEGSDTSFFGNRPLDTPAVAGAFDALKALTRQVFDGRVHLVSKAAPKRADTTRQWLAHVDLFGRTNIPEDNLHFVRERIEKGPICDRLNATHFVDDRLDVLGHLTGVPFRYLFVSGLSSHAAPAATPAWARVAEDWYTLRGIIADSLR